MPSRALFSRKFSYAAVSYVSHLLMARLMGQYWFAGWRLSSFVVCRRRLSVVVCNAAGGRDGRLPTWSVGAPAAGRVGGRAADTERQASRVTSRQGDTLFNAAISSVDVMSASAIIALYFVRRI